MESILNTIVAQLPPSVVNSLPGTSLLTDGISVVVALVTLIVAIVGVLKITGVMDDKDSSLGESMQETFGDWSSKDVRDNLSSIAGDLTNLL